MSLRREPLATRVFAVAILATLGLGYLLAMVYLYTQEVRPHRIEGHGIVQGVAITYHGVPTEPRLLMSLRGSMADTVTPDELALIEQWITDGATEEGYAGGIDAIVQDKCASCHDEGGFLPILTGYEDVVPLTSADSGIGVKKLARMTHVHLLGIPLLFFILSSFFVRTRYPEMLKAALIVLPFLAVIWDIAHWWITKFEPSAAVGVVLGGALMSTGFVLQWGLIAWDVFAPLKGAPAARRPVA